MADEKPASSAQQRSSRLAPPPTGASGLSAGAFRSTSIQPPTRSFGFGSSTSRLATTTPSVNTTARTTTFSKTAFGRTITPPVARPQRPLSAENTTTRLRQKPTTMTFGSSASSAPKQSTATALTMETATTTTTTATSSSLFSSLASEPPRSGSFPGAVPLSSSSSTASTMFNAPMSSSSSVAQPAGQLFSMDDSDLGNDDDWGVDSPNILSPASATQDDATATAAGKSFEEDEFGWADEQSSPPTATAATASAPVAELQQTAVAESKEQVALPIAPPASSSSTAWGDEFSYDAEATEATAKESAWDENGWGTDPEIEESKAIASTPEEHGAPVPVVQEVAPVMQLEAPVAVMQYAAPPLSSVSSVAAAELAAVLSPSSAPAGEFWGDESDGGLFSDEEPVETPLVVDESPLPDVATLSVSEETAHVQAEAIEEERVLPPAESVQVQASVSVNEFSYEYRESESAETATEAVEQKSAWNDDDWQVDEEEIVATATEVVAEHPAFASEAAQVEHSTVETTCIYEESASPVATEVPVVPEGAVDNTQHEVATDVSESGLSEESAFAYGQSPFHTTTQDTTGFFGGQEAHSHQQSEYHQQYDYSQQHEQREQYSQQQYNEYSPQQRDEYSHQQYAQQTQTQTDAETAQSAEASYGNYYEQQNREIHVHDGKTENAAEYEQHQKHEYYGSEFGYAGGEYSHATQTRETATDDAEVEQYQTPVEHVHEQSGAPNETAPELATRQISWAAHHHEEGESASEQMTSAEEEQSASSLSFAVSAKPEMSFGSSSFGAAELTFGHYHQDHHRTPSEAEGGSVASFAEVSSAGATFGGSDNVSDDGFSDNGSVSETRSMFGSSSVGTAFVTEPPSSSDGHSSVEDVGPIDRDSDASSAFRAGGGPYSSEFDVSSTKSALFENEVASTGFDQGDDSYSYEDQAGEHRFGPSSYDNDFSPSDVPHAVHTFNDVDDEGSIVSAHFGSEATSEFSTSSATYAADTQYSSALSPVSSGATTPAAFGASSSSQDLPTASDLEFDHAEIENPFSQATSDFAPSPFETSARPPVATHNSAFTAPPPFVAEQPSYSFGADTEETDDANPFASSEGSSAAFPSAPVSSFAAPPAPAQDTTTPDDFLPSASSLFGASPAKDTPFSSFSQPAAPQAPPAHYEELPTADAGDLFADSTPAPAFGGFQQPAASASGFFGGSSATPSHGYGYDTPVSDAYATPHSSAAAEAFGETSPSSGFATNGSADAVFGGYGHSTDQGGFESHAPPEAADAGSFFGGGSAATGSAADMFGSSDAGAYHYNEYDGHGEYAQNEYAGEYQGEYGSEYAAHPTYEATGDQEPPAGSAHGFFGGGETTEEQYNGYGAPPVDQHRASDSASVLGVSSPVDVPPTNEFFSHSHDDAIESTSRKSESVQHSARAPALSRGTSNASSHFEEHRSQSHASAIAHGFAHAHQNVEATTEVAHPSFEESKDADSFFGRSSSAPPTIHPPGTTTPASNPVSHGSDSFGASSHASDASFRAASAPPTDSNSFFASSSVAFPSTAEESSVNTFVAPEETSEEVTFSSTHEFGASDSPFASHTEHNASEPSQADVAEQQSLDDASNYFGGADTGASAFGAPAAAAANYGEDSSAYFGGESSAGPFGQAPGSGPSSFFSSGPGQHHHSGGIYAQPPQQATEASYNGYDSAPFNHQQYANNVYNSPRNDYAQHQESSHHVASPAPATAQYDSAYPASAGYGAQGESLQSESSYNASAAFGASATTATSQFPSSPYAASGFQASGASYPGAVPAPHYPSHDLSYHTPTLQPSASTPTQHFDPSPLRPAESKPSYNDYASPKAQPSYGIKYETKGSIGSAPAVLMSNKYKDPTMVVPSCLAAFGFGGNVVTMFPKQKLRLNGAAFGARNSPRTPMQMQYDSAPQGELRKGPVGVYRMEHLHPKNVDLEELDKFPGPLNDGVAEEAVLQFVDEKMNAAKGESPYEEDERLLLGVLKVLIKCNGKLRSEANANPSDPASPEVQLVSLLKESDQRRRRHQPTSFPPPKPVQYSTHADTTARNASRVRELLLLGDRKAAVDVAIQAQMWPEAMLIGSFTDKDEYKRVLCAYFTSHYAPGDPCRALYLSFADQQEKSVHEPQKLMQPQHQEDNSVILSSWVVHVQMLLANRTADTNKILVELGDRLWKEADAVVAAHICYLLAGNTVEAPSPSSKIALLGADHRNPDEARFYVSPSAVQRTEIYEWVQKKVNPAATNLIPFQGYKLIYAMILADHGKLETAFKYVNSMLTVIETITATMKPGASMYLEGMKNQLVVLDDRLRQHLGQDRADSVAAAASAKQGKWGLGSALSIMGKIVNRVVEGNDAPQQASGGPPSNNGSLFQGAPRSTNGPNPTPEYPSAAAIGYATQPAPVAAPPAPAAPVSLAPSSGRGGAPFGSRPSSYASNAPQPPAPAPLYQPAVQPGSAPHSQSGRNSAPPYQSTPDYPAPLSGNGGNSFAAPPQQYQQQHQQQSPAPAAPPASFQKPSLDLSGDAGKSGFGNEKQQLSPNRRASDNMAQPKSPRALGDGPGSDKGSSSPKFKDAKKGGRSKTPPPSRSSSGWLTGLSTFIAAKMNPEAKVAKLGEQMEAYFDEEKKRWVFPGETQSEEPTMPSAPPTGPLPGSTPSSSSGGPPGGPPGTHSAPGSMAGSATPDDPLAALMAPPTSRAHATLMKKDPLSAMMAPPSRPGFGQRATTMPAKRPPPRPQFAVFKPAPGSNVSSAPSDQGPLSSSGDQPPASE